MKKKDADLVDFNADLNKLINYAKEMVNRMQAFVYYTDGLQQKLRVLDDNYRSALHMKDVYEPDELKAQPLHADNLLYGAAPEAIP